MSNPLWASVRTLGKPLSSLTVPTNAKAWNALRHSKRSADVCLIVEGCYPFVRGGVSSWIDWLIRSQPELTFSVVSLFPDDEARPVPYKVPDNLVSFQHVALQEFGGGTDYQGNGKNLGENLADRLFSFFEKGDLETFREINDLVNDPNNRLPKTGYMNSPDAWNLICRLFDKRVPQASFIQFYWASRALLGGLFNVLTCPLPEARIYHTISTGYAGLFAARAKIETGRPVIISEHGIYTNERRIEILMADWIADTINKGLALQDRRYDLRDLWLGAFDTYARACYAACDEITTLFSGNQQLQQLQGAPRHKMSVIANGIDLERFKISDLKPSDGRTVALIGRVVPIKDIVTFIRAVGLAAQDTAGLSALIVGPMDEDPLYFEECRALVDELDLAKVITFTGNVDLKEYFPKIDVVVLSSLSEAQPLVLLEAGAAGIPCIATDVGACREILEGAADECPPLGLGGLVTGLVSPQSIATAITDLISDPTKREALGKTLCARVQKYYSSATSAAKYNDLYMRNLTSTPAASQLEVRARVEA
ncbi:GT4 family glycosyltransferase PelF [Roseibium sp. CAU 1637]|uniref:GT4 family glycosyltransferase PelF n=1 Tax=Roseibium limicola TaxID=2816037 RepID=A0A939ELB6_9HYPH|nr:GT4 family glycosyltransferase PelF [Roseibium limicola]MBO0343966.1 GT4 family glycosyltransferase PelF [Roseibium limicola]